MYTLFLICALLGGTVFIMQFVLAVIGAGAEELDFTGDMPDGVDVPDVGDLSDHLSGHGSTWLFGVISFRTVVAALTFFGLAGMGSLEAKLSGPFTFLVALAAGAVAMFSVHYLMQLLYKQRHDGTARIERTVGQRASVYIPIPAGNSGLGKIQIRTQGRIMEYAAKTPADHKLATGTTVEVTAVLTPSTVEVEPVAEGTDGTSADGVREDGAEPRAGESV